MKHTYWTPYELPSVVQGRRPWSGGSKEPIAESAGKRFGKGDGTKEINECLSCSLPDCSNCLQKRERYKRLPDSIPAGFFWDVIAGQTITDLARAYHIGRDTVLIWKHCLKITGKFPRWGSFPGEGDDEGKRKKRS